MAEVEKLSDGNDSDQLKINYNYISFETCKAFFFRNILQYKRVIWCYRIFAALHRMTLFY